MRNPTRQNLLLALAHTQHGTPPCSTSSSLTRTLAPAHLALAPAVTFTVDHTSFLSPCCTASSHPPSLCPPPARLTRLPPHTPLPPILPTPCTRVRCVLPLCTPPVTVIAQCSHCTLLSLHLAITSSGLPANFPTLQVSDFPTSRKADKSESWQVGERTAPWLPARSPRRAALTPPVDCSATPPPYPAPTT